MNLTIRFCATVVATALFLTGCASVSDTVEGAAAPPSAPAVEATPSTASEPVTQTGPYEYDYLSGWTDGTLLPGGMQVAEQPLLQTIDQAAEQDYWTAFPYQKGCYVLIQSYTPGAQSIDRVIVKYRYGNDGETLLDDSSGEYREKPEDLWKLLSIATECEKEPAASVT